MIVNASFPIALSISLAGIEKLFLRITAELQSASRDNTATKLLRITSVEDHSRLTANATVDHLTYNFSLSISTNVSVLNPSVSFAGCRDLPPPLYPTSIPSMSPRSLIRLSFQITVINAGTCSHIKSNSLSAKAILATVDRVLNFSSIPIAAVAKSPLIANTTELLIVNSTIALQSESFESAIAKYNALIHAATVGDVFTQYLQQESIGLGATSTISAHVTNVDVSYSLLVGSSELTNGINSTLCGCIPKNITSLTSSPTTSPPCLPDLNISIISINFLLKQVPIENKDCSIAGFKTVPAIDLIFLVSNIGCKNFFADANSLSSHCGKTGYPSMYKISIANITKTRSESCIEDTVAPIDFRCENKTLGMGLSAGNHYTTQTWVDLSGVALVDHHNYTVIVEILPLNPFLRKTSLPVVARYELSRRRYLRKRKMVE